MKLVNKNSILSMMEAHKNRTEEILTSPYGLGIMEDVQNWLKTLTAIHNVVKLWMEVILYFLGTISKNGGENMFFCRITHLGIDFNRFLRWTMHLIKCLKNLQNFANLTKNGKQLIQKLYVEHFLKIFILIGF